MKAGIALALLFAAAYPVERNLRREARASPAANRIGLGRLLGGVLTGPFRPMLQTYLWIRGDILYGQGRFEETLLLYEMMVSLYPDNAAAKEFLGWHIAFNYKSEAPSREIAWIGARKGLDILADLPSAHRQLADWFLKQCGQNPVQSLRYAGPAWEQERWWRARATAWGKERYGQTLERFDLGLRALGNQTRFFDQLRRLPLLVFGLADDCLRKGDSDKFRAAIRLSRWLSTQLDLEGGSAPEGWKQYFERQAWVLGELSARRLSARLLQSERHVIATALWGLGAKARDPSLLQAAATVLAHYERRNKTRCEREQALLAAWIDYAENPALSRPPLPFD